MPPRARRLDPLHLYMIVEGDDAAALREYAAALGVTPKVALARLISDRAWTRPPI
jgi:hypothetical protein